MECNNKHQNKHKKISEKCLQDQLGPHVPVLVDSVLQYLDPQRGESYLDVTAGYGGHATLVLERTANPGAATLVDRDKNAITALESFKQRGARLLHTDFYSAVTALQQEGTQFDMILADLGVSSPHLDNADRGFAFGKDGPLDMRMDNGAKLTAETVVNTYARDELRQTLRTYGEEPRAGSIAEMIVRQRPFYRTTELADAIKAIMPQRGRIHPATKTFQALRIAVNDELELLRLSLPIWFELLAPGGRIAVISFHSLEDRLVKQAFKERAGDRYDASLQLLTKRPVTADPTELVFNPRARSAKLRAAAKNKK